MPSYRAKEPGFYNSVIYAPNGKRPVLTVDKALKPCPKWLEPIKEGSPQQRKKRQAAQDKQSSDNAAQIAQDKKDIEAARIIGAANTSHVETL